MKSDAALIQIVDAALAEAARKAGPWLACRPGCFQCCIGPFPITVLDAARLRRGLAGLEARDPRRAARVRAAAASIVQRYTLEQLLADDSAAEDEPCPALDPDTGTCDLYEARPITCRTFGPPIRFGDESLAVCELCFDGATGEEVAACEVKIDPQHLEGELLKAMEGGETVVAFAIAASSSPITTATTRPHPPDLRA